LTGDSGRVDVGGEAVGAGRGNSEFETPDTDAEPSFVFEFKPKSTLSSALIPTAPALCRVVLTVGDLLLIT
jgi:hypothetical protein